jgi:hypothetical protein
MRLKLSTTVSMSGVLRQCGHADDIEYHREGDTAGFICGRALCNSIPRPDKPFLFH